eukprot:TRINITY_DN14899_c0_g1_i1.p1 TRINITY_DN14899_c0_g1~~TRINITY_DN14899_c0_g1_i1.p1  ORF type:complete len:496 (+),score=144.58 TRINITY_DN14899_c0_g1_i1:118-1605(+)
MPSIDDIPTEVKTFIMSFLTPLDLCKCSQVSKRWKDLSDQDCLWARLFPRGNPDDIPDRKGQKIVQDWPPLMLHEPIKIQWKVNYRNLDLLSKLNVVGVTLADAVAKSRGSSSLHPLLLSLCDCMDGVLTNHLGTSEDLSRFLVNVLPAILPPLLKSSMSEVPNLKPEVNKIFQKAIEVFIFCIKNRFDESTDPRSFGKFMGVFNGLFFPGNPFFAKKAQKKESVREKQLRASSDGTFARYKRPEKRFGRASKGDIRYLIENINFFGKQSGFDVILERMSSPDRSLLIMDRLTRFLYRFDEHLNLTFAEKYMTSLKTIAFEYLLALIPDQEAMTKKDREVFRRIGSTMQLLLDAYFQQDEITKLVADFNWDVITLSFNSSNVKRQKSSLKYITKLISEANKKDDQKKKKSLKFWKRSSSDDEDHVLFNSHDLLLLLDRHHIAQGLLQKDDEIIVAGFDILIFLTKHGKFDESELQRLATRNHLPYNSQHLVGGSS